MIFGRKFVIFSKDVNMMANFREFFVEHKQWKFFLLVIKGAPHLFLKKLFLENKKLFLEIYNRKINAFHVRGLFFGTFFLER